MKASEIIASECCGVGLSLCNPKAELVKKVELLEAALITCHTHHVMNDVATPRITLMIKEALNEN